MGNSLHVQAFLSVEILNALWKQPGSRALDVGKI